MSTEMRKFREDFEGQAIRADRWTAATVETGGSPSVAIKSGPADAGELEFTLDNTNEVQAARITQNDKLWLPASSVRRVHFKLKIDAEFDSANTSLAFGLISAHNATHDSIANMLLFRKVGTGNILVETDDGTTDKDDKDTGINFAAGVYKRFAIEIGARGLSDVLFYVDDGNSMRKRVLSNLTLDASALTGGLQLYAEIEKASSTDTAVMTVSQIHADYEV